MPSTRVVLAGQRAGVHQPLPQRLVEDLVDERALARSRRAGDRDQLAERDGHVDRLEVVLARAAHDQRLPFSFAALRRRGDRPLARTGTARSATPCTPARRRCVPCTTTAPAVHARPRAHLDDVIGGADRVFVVLDDDHRVADVAQALERRDHLDVVFGMQADARLVEHVEHPHQARADLRRQADALRLAAGERARAAVEVQIVEPDAEQQLEPAADLLEHLPAGVGAAAGRLDRAEERVQLVEVELTDVVDGLRPGDREQQPRRPAAARPLQSGQVCSTITLSSHASIREFASPRWR